MIHERGQVNPTDASQVACKTSIHILIFSSHYKPPQTQSHLLLCLPVSHIPCHCPQLLFESLSFIFSISLSTSNARKNTNNGASHFITNLTADMQFFILDICVYIMQFSQLHCGGNVIAVQILFMGNIFKVLRFCSY